MSRSNIVSLLDGIWQVDVRMYNISGLTSVYLVKGEKLAIVDAGIPSSVEIILKAVKEIGRNLDDVAFVVPSHIHLDHAGGAFGILARIPNARLAVHWRGARHMADPSRLLASVRQFGMFGGSDITEDIGPVDESRIISLRDGDFLDLGRGRELRVMEAPGHAPHEICLFEKKSGVVFTGDALGMYLDDGTLFMPNAVLPDFDLAQSLESIRRLKDFNPRVVLYAHSGASFEAVEALGKSGDTILQWEKVAMEAAERSGMETVVPALENWGLQRIEVLRHNRLLYEHLRTQMVPMIAAAYEKHCKQKIGMI